MKKRFISFVLCVLILLGINVGGGLTVSAASPRGPIANNGTNGIYIDILSAPYTTYANKSYGQYAYTDVGCAWFASARACQLTGKDSAIWSGQSWYDGQYANYGYSRGSQIKAKALVCYTNHVAVVERVDGNIVTISEGGVSDSAYAANGYCWITTKTIAEVESSNARRGNFLGYVYLGVSVNNEPLTKPTITTDKESYSIGDTVNVSWTASSVNSNLSHYWIIIATPSGDTLVNQRMDNSTSYSFTVNEEGSYKITVFATPIGSVSGEGSLTDEKYINVAPKAGKPTLSVKAGDSVSDTVFTWSSTENTEKYILKIDKTDKTFTKTIDFDKIDVGCALVLSAGEYEAVLSAVSASGALTESDKVSFSVSDSNDDDGEWIYTDTLPDEIKNGNYDIQYKYTYVTVDKNAPNDSFIKGEFAETRYENTGEPYWSNIELETSNTRALLSYYYYHFCGPSTAADDVNYEYTSKYVHYDAIAPDGVYETGSGTDYTDGRYKFYILSYNDGRGGAYCCSGVTCDGSYGSHGNRSNYWYRTSQYQDKVAVDYYNYYKEGTWTTAEETDYTKITYRYKESDANSQNSGDVNCDGDVNMVDVTALQKVIAQLLTHDNLGLASKDNSDCNHDGKINMEDVTRIQKYIAKLIKDLNH